MAAVQAPPPACPRPLVRLPGCVVDAGPDNLWALPERVVAAESCAFVLELFFAAQPQTVVLLGAAEVVFAEEWALDAAGPSTPEERQKLAADAVADALQRCETAMQEGLEVMRLLQRFVYRSLSRHLVVAHDLCATIEGKSWDLKKLQADESEYVDQVAQRCEEVWALLCGGSECPEAQQHPMLPGLWSVPFQAREVIWTEVAQSVMETLVEGFSRIRKCSTEGRAVMSMDLQQAQLALDKIHKARPARGKVFVDNYVKAFYFMEADLITWISQNWESYQQQHMVALVAQGVARMRTRQRRKNELVEQVKSLYAPPPSNVQMA